MNIDFNDAELELITDVLQQRLSQEFKKLDVAEHDFSETNYRCLKRLSQKIDDYLFEKNIDI